MSKNTAKSCIIEHCDRCYSEIKLTRQTVHKLYCSYCLIDMTIFNIKLLDLNEEEIKCLIIKIKKNLK